jgi:hypothetical protein
VPQLLIGIGEFAQPQPELVIGSSQRLLSLDSFGNHLFSFRDIAYGRRNQRAFFSF